MDANDLSTEHIKSDFIDSEKPEESFKCDFVNLKAFVFTLLDFNELETPCLCFRGCWLSTERLEEVFSHDTIGCRLYRRCLGFKRLNNTEEGLGETELLFFPEVGLHSLAQSIHA